MAAPKSHRRATAAETAHLAKRLGSESRTLYIGAVVLALCTLAAVGGTVAMVVGGSWIQAIVVGLASLGSVLATTLVWASATGAKAKLLELGERPPLHRIKGEWKPAGKRSPPTIADIPAFLPAAWPKRMVAGKTYVIEARVLHDPEQALKDYSSSSLLVVSVKGPGLTLRVD